MHCEVFYLFSLLLICYCFYLWLIHSGGNSIGGSKCVDKPPKVNWLQHANALDSFSNQKELLSSNFLFSLSKQKPPTEESARYVAIVVSYPGYLFVLHRSILLRAENLYFVFSLAPHVSFFIFYFIFWKCFTKYFERIWRNFIGDENSLDHFQCIFGYFILVV